MYAYHKIVNNRRVAIIVNNKGVEIKPPAQFDYADWLNLKYYKKEQ